jgi:hypothetical protein
VAAGFGEGLTGLPGTVVNALNPVPIFAGPIHAAQDIYGVGRDLATLGPSGAISHWTSPDYRKWYADRMGARIADQYAPGQAVTHGLNTALGVTGLNPEDVSAPVTWDERLGRNIGLGASGAVIPGGQGAYLANVGRNIIPAIASGVGKDIAEEVSPDILKPVTGILGSLGGGFAGSALQSARPFTPSASTAANLADFTTEGIPPVLSAVTASKPLGFLEATLAKSPGGVGIYDKAIGAAHDALRDRIDATANAIGPVVTPQKASNLIFEGVNQAADRFKTTQDRLYSDALKPVLGIKPRSLQNLETLGAEWFAQNQAAPESLQGTTGAALGQLNAILRDTATGNMNLDTLRQIRTNIGRDIGDPVLAGISSSMQPYLRRMYAALSSDIDDIATKADPSIAAKLAVANRYTRLNQKRFDIVRDIVGNDRLNGEIYQALINTGTGPRGGGQALMAMRRTLTPEQWDTVAGTALGRLGLARAGAQGASAVSGAPDTFSPATFLTNWSNLAPEAKQALFGGSRYASIAPALDRLVRVTDKMKGFDKLLSGSPTYERTAHGALFSIAGTLLGRGILAGDLESALGEAGVAVLAGYALPKLGAKLMTNPKFIAWLANRAQATSPAARSASDNAIRALAVSSPEIAQLLSLKEVQSP